MSQTAKPRPRFVAWALFVSATLALGLPAGTWAQPQAPPPPINFFTDTAGVVSPDIAARLEARLREFQASSSNQVLVVVADRVPDGYTSMEEYTNRTAEAWRVGDKARDNGAVLFVFVADRKIRIEVGYGLEGALPDALASRIINDDIAPRFRSGNYGEGLSAGVEAIIAATKGEYQPLRSSGRASSRTFLIILLVLFFLFIGVIIPLLREIHAISNSRTYSGRGRYGGRSSGGWGSSTGWGGGWSGGGGSSWGGGGGGGGGFSGGGGSFGGGGASGSW